MRGLGGLLGAAAMMALGVGGMAAPGLGTLVFAEAVREGRAAPSLPAAPASDSRAAFDRRYSAPGWSVAQDRRNAHKRRNQARNRRAHRG